MKKLLILLLTLLLLTGCSKVEKFEKVKEDALSFHSINMVEKVRGGVLYLNGDKLLYNKNNNIEEISSNTSNLWREKDNIYYESNDTFYKYNIKTKKKNVISKKPYRILGKYKDNIISYTGRSIFTINDTGRVKMFKDGYYLNDALLYKNKVYGIPASNVYEYNLDTLKVNKVTKMKHNMSYLSTINNIPYITTITYKNYKKNNIGDYKYYKITDSGLKHEFTIKNISMINDSLDTQNGIFLATQKSDKDITNGNELLFVSNGKIKRIDKNYSYNLLGIYDNKLLYYKNKEVYGESDNNLKTFYFYNGKKTTKAFDLNFNYYEGIYGYPYDNGVIINISYESGEDLYNYNGKTIKKINIPSNVYRIINLNILDNKLYMNYSDGEESFDTFGTIIDLK